MTLPEDAIAEAASWTLALCDRIAAETDQPGTITRLFLSPATARVHTLLQREMHALGLAVSLDAAGNLRGIYAAETHDAPVLLLGSHIDTVPDAGRYDGVLGVAAALALVRLLHGRRLAFAMEVIAFSEEEGVRFRMPFIGSRALVGTLGEQELARRNADGITLAHALAGFHRKSEAACSESLQQPLLSPRTFAFLELHIEQGPVLESLGMALGVVEAIVGQTRLEIAWHGQANHAGTTPMPLRHDALAAAAEFIVATEAEAYALPGLVATVGVIAATPGAPNIVSGQALCSLDVRHAQDDVRLEAVRRLETHAQAAGARRGVRVESRETNSIPSVSMASALVRALLKSAQTTGSPAHRMHSGAGHDAMIVAGAVPSAMLFVRTPGGLSHHPDEAVATADLEAALAAMLHLVEQLEP